jgi:uncharacterized protein
MRPPREDTQPWYRQFWPWFLIALPGSVVIASMITIYLAATTENSLVKDDYYKEGLAINQDRARQRNAAALNIVVDLNFDRASSLLTADINEAAIGEVEQLNLVFAHPTLSSLDARVTLNRSSERQYIGQLNLQDTGAMAWHVEATPPEATWKLRGKWHPFRQSNYELRPTQFDAAEG